MGIETLVLSEHFRDVRSPMRSRSNVKRNLGERARKRTYSRILLKGNDLYGENDASVDRLNHSIDFVSREFPPQSGSIARNNSRNSYRGGGGESGRVRSKNEARTIVSRYNYREYLHVKAAGDRLARSSLALFSFCWLICFLSGFSR